MGRHAVATKWDKGDIMRLPVGEYERDIFNLVKKIRHETLEIDVVLAIGRGGLIPAVYISYILDIPMITIFANRYSREGNPQGETQFSSINGLFPLHVGHTILVVDDMTDHGTTMGDIIGILTQLGHTKIISAVVYYRSASKYTPMFYGKRIENDTWIHFPYDLCIGEDCRCGGIPK